MLIRTVICSGVQESKLTDLTFEMWTPKFLCIPAQRIHKNTPRFHEAHLGPKRGDKPLLYRKYQRVGVIFLSLQLENDPAMVMNHVLPFAPQSEQYLLVSSFNISASITWFLFFMWSFSLCDRAAIFANKSVFFYLGRDYKFRIKNGHRARGKL